MGTGIVGSLVVLDPGDGAGGGDVNCTPRLTCDVSESDRTAGVSELENKLTVGVFTVEFVIAVAMPPRPSEMA